MKSVLESAAVRGLRGRVQRVAPFIVGQFGAALTTLIAGVLVARELGPAGRGVLAVISIADESALRLVGGGLPELSGRMQRLGRGRLGDLRRLLAAYMAGSVVVLLGPSAWMVRALFETTGWSTIAWGAALAVAPAAGVWRAHLRHVAFAQGRVRVANAIPVVQWGVVAAAFVILAELSSDPVVLIGLSYVLGVAASTAFAAMTAPHFAPGTPGRPLRGVAREYIRPGSMAVAGSLGTIASARLDQLVVVGLLGRRAAGLYAVAATLPSAMLQLGNALAWSAYKEAAESHDGGVSRRRLNRMTLAVAGLCAPAVVVAPILIPALFGQEFRGAVFAAQVLLVAAPLQARIIMVVVMSTAGGAPRVGAAAQVTCILVGLGLLPLFASAWGINGAAAASAVGCVAGVAVAEVASSRVSRPPRESDTRGSLG